MNMDNLKTIAQCLTADITKDRVALHETGHVIAMYAVGMIEHLAYVTKKDGDGTLGLTEVSEEYKARMKKLGDEIIQAAGNLHYGKDSTRIIQLSRQEASQLYFPNICKLKLPSCISQTSANSLEVGQFVVSTICPTRTCVVLTTRSLMQSSISSIGWERER